MAIFVLPGREVADILADYVGFKAGLVLTRDELVAHMPNTSHQLPPPTDEQVRLRHDAFEAMLREVLYRVGATSSPSSTLPPIRLTAKYQDQPRALDILDYIVGLYIQCTRDSALTTPFQPIDLTPVMVGAFEQFGVDGYELWKEFYALVQDWTMGSSLGVFRRVEWSKPETLKELFTSEKISTSEHGTFIDQRFVDYLARNFDAVDRMNWRKFEALVAEYFDKLGFAVHLGTGRADGGVDIRVWKNLPVEGDPATLLIQCKRQGDNVDKTVVKALWADLLQEDVSTGLIVTSHALEPGAAATAKKLSKTPVARGYHVGHTGREKLRKWIETMRTPGTGIFLP